MLFLQDNVQFTTFSKLNRTFVVLIFQTMKKSIQGRNQCISVLNDYVEKNLFELSQSFTKQSLTTHNFSCPTVLLKLFRFKYLT
jgi:hypothetical protein